MALSVSVPQDTMAHSVKKSSWSAQATPAKTEPLVQTLSIATPASACRDGLEQTCETEVLGVRK